MLNIGPGHVQLGDLEIVSIAAKFRVAHREAAASGGLQVLRRSRELDEALQAVPCWLRGPLGALVPQLLLPQAPTGDGAMRGQGRHHRLH